MRPSRGAAASAAAVLLRLLDPDKVAPQQLERGLDCLTTDERRRAEAFQLAQFRHQYLCTRLLQRRTLSDLAGIPSAAWRFSATANGRPEVAEPARLREIGFSLSHTTGLIICAAARGMPVGVDVEHVAGARDVERLAARFFAPEEAAAVSATAPAARIRRFLQFWTVKEACLKGLGTGLGTPLDAVRLLGVDGGGRATVAFSPAALPTTRHWQVQCSEPTPDHVMAIAVQAEPGTEVRVDQAWAQDPV